MERHKPVLLEKVIEVLAPKTGEDFVDFTGGWGGHSAALVDAVGDRGNGYIFDQDPTAVAALQKRFKSNHNVVVAQANFAELNYEKSVPIVDMMLADLGVSSPQLDEPERGFSFKTTGPLDMRMNPQQSITAADIVNSYKEEDIANIIYQYGEERHSRRIARAIIEARKQTPITTTTELSNLITSTVKTTGHIHPATRTFQALRIAVNNELGALERFLAVAPTRLSAGGRLAIISFHSLEDRLVKQHFKTLCSPVRDDYGQIVSEPSYRKITKKPIMGKQFDINNPRARSAKLRAVEKIN
jgi:16S rRNA (cytosine1402-N4)-methyltransferase